MGNLSNLYISQSFQSLIHLGNDGTASASLIELEDGYGNGIGLSVNTAGDLKVDGILSASIITELSQSIVNINGVTGSYATTGSNTFVGNQTITGDVQINGTLSATEIHTLIESSSIIFSSGSNILGDSVLDTQTLNGTIIMSGSGQLTGSIGITGTISSPTITTINSQLTNIEAFTQSANIRLTNLESTSASVNISVSNLNQFTASQQIVNSNLNQFTQSIIGTNPWTASIDSKFTTLSSYTASNDTKWNTLGTQTGSFATTGSNTFNGSQTISGSVYGNVNALSITSNTASMNMSLGNLFTLSLSTGSTHLDATNVGLGQTVNLLITQNATGTGTLTLSPEFFQPAGFVYTATPVSGAQDILTFVTFGSTSKVYAVNAKQFV